MTVVKRLDFWNQRDLVAIAIGGLVLVSQSCRLLFATPWTAAHQVPVSMRFSREGYWSGLPFPSPEDLPEPGTQRCGSPALQADSMLTELQGNGLG